jgi:hypothetical protein
VVIDDSADADTAAGQLAGSYAGVLLILFLLVIARLLFGQCSNQIL